VINASSLGMKALPKKLLPLTLFGIAVTSLFFVRSAQAYTVTLEEVGTNVVASGSGAIDLTGLSLIAPNFGNVTAGIAPSDGAINVAHGFVSAYRGYSGPSSFGTGGFTFATLSSGDAVGINFGSFLFVPNGYVSGTALSDTSTYNGATFASLGVTPGTYVWTWGTGLPNQNFTLVIGAAGVPDGGATVSLLGCALLGLGALRRKLGC
jgi:VPDSG-CTERM motif